VAVTPGGTIEEEEEEEDEDEEEEKTGVSFKGMIGIDRQFRLSIVILIL
jgi:hypothetical protein